jgi:hypothetical protein
MAALTIQSIRAMGRKTIAIAAALRGPARCCSLARSAPRSPMCPSGRTWDPTSDQWEEGFSRLLHYVEHNGHALVATSNRGRAAERHCLLFAEIASLCAQNVPARAPGAGGPSVDGDR